MSRRTRPTAPLAPDAPRPSVTVVVPVLDDAPALRRCLAAVAAQTVPPNRVVVVDNGSRDDSVAVATAAGAEVLAEPVRGIASAASRGYDAATTDVIARIDSDTVLPSDWLARALPAFADPTVVAVTGPGRFADLPPVTARFWQLAYMRAYFVLVGLAVARPPVFGSNVAFTRAAWRRVSPRVDRTDARLHDDIDLSLHLDPAWRVVHDPRLRVDVSSDPVRSGLRELVDRGDKALHTLARHGRTGVPTTRWIRRAWTALRPPSVPSAAVGLPASAWAVRPTPPGDTVPGRAPVSLGGAPTGAEEDRSGATSSTTRRKERAMARTTSEAEGQDEADATTHGGMDAPSQAEGGDVDDQGRPVED